jgi:hypothetical protein
MEAPDLLELLTKIAAIAVPIIGGFFTVFFRRNQAKQNTASYIQAVRVSWLQIDSVALADDILLREFHRILNPENAHMPIEAIRRKWCAYTLLNVIYLDFLGIRAGLANSCTSENVRLQLMTIVSQDDLFYLTQTGYSNEFHSFALTLRNEYLHHQCGRTCSDKVPAEA